MPSARIVVNGALRKIGILAAGREARTSDAADALEALNGLYAWLITSGAFGRLRDVIPTADYTACGNERIYRMLPTITITLPDTVPADWNWYCDGWGPYPPLYANSLLTNQAPPRDCAVVAITDQVVGTSETWINDAFLRQWQAVGDIGLDDPAPLSARDPQGLQSLLASRIADQFGGDLPQMTALQASQMVQGLTARFASPASISPGVYF